MAIAISMLNGGIGCIQPEGKLVGGPETDELRSTVNDLVEKSTSKIVIDLSKVLYINSTGIGALVAIHTTYRRRQWRVVLCGLNAAVLTILTITNLAMVFEAYGDRNEAVAHLAEGPTS